MNYYEHHLGDYLKKTAHLSMLEDGAYRRLLDRYYTTEQPLPLDIKECCKLARATSKPERDAVAAVIKEFFERTPGGYQQNRAEQEIARFSDKQNKARRSANARWSAQQTHTERIANASSTASPNAMRTQCEGNAPRARPQSPDSSNQTPNPSESVGVITTPVVNFSPPKTPLPPNFGISNSVRMWAKGKGYEQDLPEYLEAFRLKAEANGYTKTSWDSSFKTSMLEDWGKVRDKKKNSSSGGKTARQLIEEAEAERATR